ncbi:hypothetical protein SVIO_010460 [Streptomyces violaceusniger]|uniref:Uncharacterized protein n=1 Tax=Streptomyces violaceusniger TaxID=68280 RepID=A0A4D4KX98_STRVO|nr:hypothetical protein SVIO_010460 [Streptomyces violaceusniger]
MSPSGGRELLVDFGAEGGVALDDPARYPFIAGPSGVLDQERVRYGGGLGGLAHCLVVRVRDLGDLRPLRGDGRHGLRVDTAWDEDPGAVAEQACRPGHGAAVVAVGGAHQGDGRGGIAACGPCGEGAVHGPGRAQGLESGQAQTARLVLDEDPPDPQFGGERGSSVSGVGA